MIPFGEKLKKLLKENGITVLQFEDDTGICKKIMYNRKHDRTHHRSTLMAIAYYLHISVEDLVEGTDAEELWYR